MYNLKIRVLAQLNIQESVDHYDAIDKKITNNFLNNLYSELEIIQQNPLIFSIKYKEIRICYLKNFPFGIHFYIKKNDINILAVLHTSRNPEIWKKR